jgi:hypothetical protein
MVREASSLKEQAVPAAIFDSLRKSEYLKIVRDHFGLPGAPNTQIYRACKELFCRLPSAIAHDAMVQVLKERGNCHSLKTFIQNVPFSLKAASIACKLTGQEQMFFVNLLHTSAKQCLLSN